MLKAYIADLHIHSCLSPCADIDMTPRNIVGRAIKKGIDIITITDHNSAENVEATQRAAQGTGLVVLAGMEITSSEEAHLLALFQDLESIWRMQDILYGNLPETVNDERLYGEQIIVNEHDEVLGFNKRLLIGALNLSISAILKAVSSLGGIAIASHIDREAFSVISQLGFIPDDLNFDAVEFSPNISRSSAEAGFSDLKHFSWVSFSDAHHPDDIGRRVSTLMLREPTFSEISLAFKKIAGRDVLWS